MALPKEWPEGGQRLARRRPLVLPRAEIICRLRLPAAPVASVVLPVVLDVVLLDALDLLQLPIDERCLVLVPLPLLAADPLVEFAFLSESQQLML